VGLSRIIYTKRGLYVTSSHCCSLFQARKIRRETWCPGKAKREFSGKFLYLIFNVDTSTINMLSKQTIFSFMYYFIVGTHSTLFHYTPYILWEIWLAKSRFHEYAWCNGDQSSSNEIACYNKILFNLNNVIQGFSYQK